MRSTRIEKSNRRWFVVIRPAQNAHNRSSRLSRADPADSLGPADSVDGDGRES